MRYIAQKKSRSGIVPTCTYYYYSVSLCVLIAKQYMYVWWVASSSSSLSNALSLWRTRLLWQKETGDWMNEWMNHECIELRRWTDRPTLPSFPRYTQSPLFWQAFSDYGSIFESPLSSLLIFIHSANLWCKQKDCSQFWVLPLPPTFSSLIFLNLQFSWLSTWWHIIIIIIFFPKIFKAFIFYI